MPLPTSIQLEAGPFRPDPTVIRLEIQRSSLVTFRDEATGGEKHIDVDQEHLARNGSSIRGDEPELKSGPVGSMIAMFGGDISGDVRLLTILLAVWMAYGDHPA